MEDTPTTRTLYFDGLKYSYGVGVSINLVSPINEVIHMAYKLGFECTNNITEYEALILGHKVAISIKIKDLEIYDDSQLMVNRVNDTYNTKDEQLNSYKIIVTELLDEFNRYSIQNIPWNNNRYADIMASATSLVPIEIEDEKTILIIKNLGTPSYLDHIEEVHVFHLNLDIDSEHWHVDIYNYLKDQLILYDYDKNEKI